MNKGNVNGHETQIERAVAVAVENDYVRNEVITVAYGKGGKKRISHNTREFTSAFIFRVDCISETFSESQYCDSVTERNWQFCTGAFTSIIPFLLVVALIRIVIPPPQQGAL